MVYHKTADCLATYQTLSLASEMDNASPYRLIQLLLNGALEKIDRGLYSFANGHDVNANQQISWAVSIIDGLRMSLDKTVVSPITDNLDDLYDYMGRRLLQAQIEKKPDILDEVKGLLLTIKSAWDEIPEEAKNAHQSREHYLSGK